jgi:methyl-accepting chemotaxis protein
MFNSIQTKLEAFVVFTILVTAAILISIFSYQLGQSEDHLLDALSGKQDAISNTVLDKTVTQMEKNVFAFTRDQKLIRAIKTNDKEMMAARIGPTANRLEATGAASNIRVLGLNGDVLYTRNEGDGSNVTLKLAQQAATELILKRGLEAVNGVPEIHFVFPLTEKGKPYAVIDIAMDYPKLAASFADISGGKFIAFDLQGKQLSKTDEAIEKAFANAEIDVSEYAINTLDHDGKSYSAVNQPLIDVNNKTVGYVVTLKDDTELNSAQDASSTIGLIAIVGWIIFIFFITKVQSTKTFKPLQSMQKVVNSIGNEGDFSKRIPLESDDEIGQTGRAINNMVDSLQTAISESNTVMHAVAKGDFSKQISGQLKGDLASLQDAVNQSTKAVEFSMQEIIKLVSALSRGDFSAKMDSSVDANIRTQVESSLKMMSDVISDVNMVLAFMAKGDYSKRVSAEASGELEVMADNVNQRVSESDKALTEIASVASNLASGNFTSRINSQFGGKFGEVATALNGSIDNLAKLIAETTDGVHSLTGNVDQIYQGSQDLNDRTQRQAASLEQTTATMDQILHAVKQTTDNAQSANHLASSARTQADQGADIMRSTIESMTDIKEASHKIEEIISLIDSIAFQTNLLALNAAVEAARAGEHGRGFAVVAGEVRNLAGKSADAARDIKTLIENAVQAVDQGTERAERSDEALQNITESIRKVSDIVAEISTASDEQAHSISQIGAAVGDIDNVTQQNAALVEESTAASETMRTEAESLANLVSKFKV